MQNSSVIQSSHAACRRITRHHARSFFFASHTLPPQKRQAAYAVYAFCRYVDDLLDETDPQTVPLPESGWHDTLNDLLDRLYSGQETSLEFAPAFRETVLRYQIPRQPFSDLIRGVCLDHQPLRLQTWPELKHYCYHVASVVGLILCPIFGLKRKESQAHAIDLGIAMQLTNILRDIQEDGARGRLYLPAEELRRFGVHESDLVLGRTTPEFVDLMQFQIQRARGFFSNSEQGIPDLENDGSQLTVWLMRYVYAGILDEIERMQYDVFSRRATVGPFRKLILAGKAWYYWKCQGRTNR